MDEAIVLAGGKGTRLAPYTTVFPKPLMPVGDMPVLEILLRQLVANGFTRVHLAVGHLAELIEAFFGDGERLGVELRYWREDEPLGTAGPLAQIDVSAESVLVMNGDLFTTIDFRDVIQQHVESGATATIGVLRRDVPIDFGVVHLEQDSVVGFEEKPVLSYEVSMGIYVFTREALELIPRGEHFDFPDLLLALLERGLPVHAYRYTDFWLDIGRPEDYERANAEFEGLRPRLLPAS
jgi:NDP-sugar pyrophosphorylase family protein